MDGTTKIDRKDLAKILARVKKKEAVFYHDLVEIAREELKKKLDPRDVGSVISLMEFNKYLKKDKVGHRKDKALVSDKEIVYMLSEEGEKFIQQYI